MGKIYLEKNVLEAAIERLQIMFENFENIYFSVSGGKDSSVMVQLANKVAKTMNKKFDVLFIDLEAQYRHTIEHIEEYTPYIRTTTPDSITASIRTTAQTRKNPETHLTENSQNFRMYLPDNSMCRTI